MRFCAPVTFSPLRNARKPIIVLQDGENETACNVGGVQADAGRTGQCTVDYEEDKTADSHPGRDLRRGKVRQHLPASNYVDSVENRREECKKNAPKVYFPHRPPEDYCTACKRDDEGRQLPAAEAFPEEGDRACHHQGGIDVQDQRAQRGADVLHCEEHHQSHVAVADESEKEETGKLFSADPPADAPEP